MRDSKAEEFVADLTSNNSNSSIGYNTNDNDDTNNNRMSVTVPSWHTPRQALNASCLYGRFRASQHNLVLGQARAAVSARLDVRRCLKTPAVLMWRCPADTETDSAITAPVSDYVRLHSLLLHLLH